MGDGPDGAALIGGRRRRRLQELRQERTQRSKYRGRNGHDASALQVTARFIHQRQRIAGRLMGEMEIDHGGGDVLGLGDEGWIDPEVLVDEPELAVVGTPGAVGVVAQGESLARSGPSTRRDAGNRPD